jgi:hypothetical protein
LVEELVFGLALILASVPGVPPFFQPPADFYGATGGHVTVAASAEPVRVPANRPILFTLTVHGATIPAELIRPPLRDLPEFAKRFEVEDLPARSPGVFEYHLRPRTTDTDRVPRVRFAYYNPAAAEGKQFPVTYTDAIPITVLPPVAETKPVSFAVPAIFREAGLDRDWPIPAGPGWLAGLSLAVLGLGAGYVVWWRWRNPDGVRLARIRQTRAVRRVTARLAAAAGPDDIADAVHAYLVERFGVPIPSAAPCDVDASLERIDFDEPKREAVVQLLRRCDAARFGNGDEVTATLADEAKRMVHGWEGLPC